MNLDQFNGAATAEAGELLTTCAPIASWRAGLLARRPYASVEELISTAATLAEGWTDQEVDAALAHHPRIGEKVRGESAEAKASRSEQGSLSEDDDARQAWIKANEAYEAQFDRIFLIRAKGRTPEEMMDLLQERLKNTPQQEALVRREQLAEIAVLRLREALNA
ncbi:2-oxo-4-hydroxy-4-carboxy-5-ureidoimidazoline decarboxylase [Nesterenkonia flava]|uniref:2-oxo-4-hydroxy-4-carboxy-5-ureidoimidazoline decarboxylase n=1 Tax=Nesterenkonia flava TaxID=469799 RepID=A0ABU1FV76_9MICC|nr:2-oxo-4-hydroxy-4-carboxy-5-ureidoimidazoline decarboxylase [Nesterenkonia flava]MDR5712523.1 2-oxo-4-hydroxy-4-carboxy-5-ureidoimidazoline decarboxylase [Nesterenkonia flava]